MLNHYKYKMQMVLIDLKMDFVVDNFTGHNVGDVGNNDYKLSIDRGRGEARTPFNEDVMLH
jgi:hypothetical protein